MCKNIQANSRDFPRKESAAGSGGLFSGKRRAEAAGTGIRRLSPVFYEISAAPDGFFGPIHSTCAGDFQGRTRRRLRHTDSLRGLFLPTDQIAQGNGGKPCAICTNSEILIKIQERVANTKVTVLKYAEKRCMFCIPKNRTVSLPGRPGPETKLFFLRTSGKCPAGRSSRP